MTLDNIDMQLLALIQSDDSISNDTLAQQVGLSKTPCWRRIQKLENAGYIKRRVALLDADKLELGVSVFVQVKTNQHEVDWATNFSQIVAEFPEVVEFYRMAGEYDYLLRVVVKDIPAYDRFYKRLISATALTDVTSNFAMEQIKYTTELPLSI
ncbi:Leucine-responsive regulatory protein [Marinomonas spartinae]|uniref:Leucine-responsive regulatory protein n=1 Tax=Marinomonas spartinae TaxID=1792290 RepID=A0A1A8TRA2_9GAMM|nr:Lrp/AsnC family transcriptional regulator [Marinomonas spartinae]SBS32959.1 Leucine-responsive regulatory protein [Marinomonas spartinae]SBS35737.1 Leucine-responsive regulatory protein [Marinomonas spartinae]